MARAERLSVAVVAAATLSTITLSTSALAADYRHPLGSRSNVYVTAYKDHNDGSGLSDWNCGQNTYNGHRGTDIGIGGFARMDNGSVEVMAAADGTVQSAVDGNFDRCTTADCPGGGGFGNFVSIRHDDGKVTFYGHLKNGSVRVSAGQRVSCGTVLGKVGSSGFSTGPHLHFEPRVNNVGSDPFDGPCSGPPTYWVSQGDYNSLPGSTCEGESSTPLPTPDIDPPPAN